MISAAGWSPADGLTLEPNALIAATEDVRSLALTAGPGAGKTEMLAQRADFLLRTGLCRYPRRILAISFKVDASRNLKERVKRRCGSSMSARFDSHTFHAFAKRIVDRFRPVLVGPNALDADYTIGGARIENRQITFLELVPLAIQILQTSEVARNAIRQTYTDVFLDEFQDCTGPQYALIKLAFQDTSVRLTAVGDTKQKIMGWAGALEGIFLTFAKDFQALPLNIYRNFRSLPQLLRLQNEIVKVLEPAAEMPLELLEGDGGEVSVQYYSTSQEEAKALAKQIQQWVTIEQIPHSEIAVLLSKQPELYADLLMSELELCGIPFRNEQLLQDLSTEPVAQLIVNYLLVLFGGREPDAYSRLMEQLTDTSVDDNEQTRERRSWLKFIKDERKKIELLELLGADFDSCWVCASTFLRAFGRARLVSLASDYESFARLKEVVAETKQRLRELLTLEIDVAEALRKLTDERAVRIMSIHKSKGLEFDTVIILGAEEETFWGKPDEERCAFFVAVSRAKRRLLLTVCGSREKPPSNPYKWRIVRTPHVEYLEYAAPFLMSK